MIASLILSVLLAPVALPAPRVLSFQDGSDPAVDAKIAEAGKDVAKLLDYAKTLSTGGKDDDAKKVYKKVVELDPKNEEAHKALRHHNYDGKWFESYADLSKYRREETAKMKEKGLVRYKEEWVAEADLPYLNMGWTKDGAGKWQNPVEVARDKQIAEWKSASFSFRPDDSTWIAPADVPKWQQLQWKCGEEWVELAKANEYHSQIGQWWQLDGEHFVVWTTCDWQSGNSARWYAEKIYPAMVTLFGLQPAKKPHFIVLNSQDQYNQAAGGNPPSLPESEGLSSLHGAYFSDVLFDPTTQPPQYLGCGVSYWDQKDEKLKAWGPYFLRWAAAQSYVDAIDPSWLALSELLAAQGGGGQPNPGAFWAEKKIPRWLRYGAAAYAERFMKDPDAQNGGNPWALREFAFGEIKKAGGLHKIEDIFAFTLDPQADPDNSKRLYFESGLLVSFLLDGADGDKKLHEKHNAFKAALASGNAKTLAEAIDGLQKELLKNEKDIKKYAELKE